MWIPPTIRTVSTVHIAMSVLAASVCLSSGEILLSRQFVELSAPRVHDMLSACSLLLNDNTHRTTMEENGMRYICEPLDDLFVVLISDAESSNILQDLKTLHLLTQLVKQVAAPNSTNVESDDVINATFSIIDAFDEVVTMGYSENLSESQVETFMKMESYEERIQQIIEHNKQLEAAEHRKRMAKQLESERLSNEARASSGLGSSGLGSSSGIGSDFGMGSSNGYSLGSARREPLAAADLQASESVLPEEPKPRHATQRAGSGLKLGRATAHPEVPIPDVPAAHGVALPTPPTPSFPPKNTSTTRTSSASSPAPASTTTDISISEQLTIDALRDGTIKQSRASGTLSLVAGNREHTKLKIQASTGGAPSDYKPHPKMDRALFASERVLGLKNANEDLPASQVLLVKWTVDNVPVPLSVSCWVSDSSDAGFKNVTLEYELDSQFPGKLENIVVSVPLPTSNAHGADPTASFEQFDDRIVWTVPEASADEPTGSFEFTAEASEEDDFYPLEVSFQTSEQTGDLSTFGKIDVSSVSDAATGDAVEFNKTAVANTASYIIR